MAFGNSSGVQNISIVATGADGLLHNVSCDNTGALSLSGTIAGSENLTQVAGVNLGSPSNYGTSPGAVAVIGVNAFVTNAVTVAQATAANLNATVVFPSAQPISAASLPLPSGASTSAKQPALGTAGTASADVITVQGITSMTPLVVSQATAANLNATVVFASAQAVTQSGTWTVQPGNTANTTPWLQEIVPVSDANGYSTNVQQALKSTAASVKGSAGKLHGYAIGNPNASTIVYVFFYNNASPTVGSTTNLLYQIQIPGGGAANFEIVGGIPASAAITVAASTSATSAADPATGLVVTTLYK